MMRKGFFLLAVLFAAGAAEASAQEVTARIAGLEGNAEYMEMLREEASLQAREDSVTMVVNRVRRQLRDDPAQRAVLYRSAYSTWTRKWRIHPPRVHVFLCASTVRSARILFSK